MPRLLRSTVAALAGLFLAACSTSDGTGWVATTGAGGTTSPEVTTSTAAAAASTTTTSLPGPPSSSGTSTAPAYCPEGANGACAANTAAGAAFLAANVNGGTYGFRFVRIGGEVVGALRPEQAFYPASSVKVLLHLHAVRWVADQPDRAAALTTPTPVCDNSCVGGGSCRTEPLRAVLEAMMLESDNRRANAVLDFFGFDAIAETTAQVVGATGTRLVHRFGCGGPANDPANESTALDLSRVFERALQEEVLDAEAFATFTGLMLGPVWPSLAGAVAAEGEAAGLAPEAVDDFLAAVRLSYKAGWWETNLSVGGLLTLPAGPCSEEPPRQYAFAVFVSQADAVAAGFDVSDVVGVVLREEIRSALEEWAEPSCRP